MKQIIIDKATRIDMRKKFRVDNPFMTRTLKYQNDGILARRIRAHILNFREFHIIQ